MKNSLFLLFLISGCSSSNIKVLCDSNRNYFISYATISGNCGNIPSRYVALPIETQDCNTNITYQSLDKCSENLIQDCSYTSVPALPSGNIKEHNNVSLQEDFNGKLISGTWETSITFADGSNCSGSYELSGHRL